MTNRRSQVEPTLSILQRVLNVQVLVTGDMSIRNRTTIRLITKATITLGLVINDELDTVIVILQRSVLVLNITLELAQLVSRERVHQCSH